MELAGFVMRRTAAAIAVFVCLTAPASRPAAQMRPVSVDEIRGLWVLRTSLTSPERIRTLVRSAKDHGFNTLLVQIRARGDAYYSATIEPRAAELSRQATSFDPLAEVLRSAHAAGLRVHAWMNVNLVSSAADLPTARQHIVHRHPEWLMVPRDLARELAKVDTESPGYVGRLARWTRAQSDDIEGLYASPLLPGAAAHLVSVVRDLAQRYAVDGVHFDYVRFPSDRFDYSRQAIREFRLVAAPQLAAPERARLDREERIDPFAYPDALPEAWRQFRVSRLTDLVRRLRETVKRERANATITVAAAPDRQEALDRRLQDWGGWLAGGLVDAICPMAYTPEPAQFAEQIAAAREAAGTRAVWAGIGAYRLSPSQTVDNIRTARRLGAAGVVLFSYDSMTNPRQSAPDYLALVARGAFRIDSADAGSR
jgi:uncharacterized lipoprotein YddW (UPF0748 family)